MKKVFFLGKGKGKGKGREMNYARCLMYRSVSPAIPNASLMEVLCFMQIPSKA